MATTLRDGVRQPARRRRRRAPRSVWPLVILVAVGSLAWLMNSVRLDRPLTARLSTDYRNNGFQLRAHYGNYVDWSTLVLDLERADAFAPADLWRGVLQAAAVFDSADESFTRVEFARSGREVYTMPGDDFGRLGQQYRRGRDQLSLVTDWTQSLRRTDGAVAFGRWAGPPDQVAALQLDDAATAAESWASGQPAYRRH